jgi:hypothetical protein
LFDEAVDAYESLRRIVPSDASVTLRLALAHAGAGRLDVATRLIERVSQTGGRDDDVRLGELASITSAVLLASAREHAVSAAEGAELLRRLAQTPLPDVASLIWIQSSPADDTLQIQVARDRERRDLRVPEFDARVLGLSAIRIERGDGSARVVFSRAADPGPQRAIHAAVAALVLGPEHEAARLVTREIELAANVDHIELSWDGEAFL